MNPGIVSLRCPACARPFLSLPLQRESQVTCPHCQRQGTAGSYAAAGSTPGEAMIHSLKQRSQQPAILQPRPSVPNGSAWPAAPPAFSGPARLPPLSAEEPQWPFLQQENDEPVSPFSQLDLETIRRRDEEFDPYLTEPSERNAPLGILLLVLVIAAIWVAWQTLQPPMVTEIPVAVPEAPPEEPQTYRTWLEEAAAAAELAPELEKYPPSLAR